MTPLNSPRPVGAGVRIGHVHLKVADLERALGFYRDVLGFEITQRYGTQAVFLSAYRPGSRIARCQGSRRSHSPESARARAISVPLAAMIVGSISNSFAF